MQAMEIRSLGGVAPPRPSALAGTISGATTLAPANPAFCRNLRRELIGISPCGTAFRRAIIFQVHRFLSFF
jgi:hypothetical protein